MATVNDRIPLVVALLGGRTDLQAQIAQWLANGYMDLVSSIPFETLEATATPVTVPNQDTYDYPSDARAIKSLTIGIPANNPTSFPPLRKRSVALLDRYTNVPGVPSIWAPFKNQIIVRAVPNDAYPLIIRYWQSIVLPSDLTTLVLNVSQDWLEIIDYQAQMRGFMDLQEYDKAANIRALLYGNPRKPGMPGLIKQRLTQIQAEAADANYGMRPRKTRYSHVR